MILTSVSPGNFLAAFLLRRLGSLGQTLCDLFGLGSSVRLKTVKAIYWPVWRCDAIFEGPARAKQSATNTNIEGYFSCQEAYVPGNSFEPLSYHSLAVPPLGDDLPVYRPERDLTQLGEGFEIVPVPFSATPFGLLDLIKKELGKRVEWEGLTILPEEWKETMVCLPGIPSTATSTAMLIPVCGISSLLPAVCGGIRVPKRTGRRPRIPSDH